jgi:nucleotide-binding universal stress UspA family protein
MSPIQSLLVHLDAGLSCVSRLQVARDIAERHGSVVTALYAVTPALIQIPLAGGAASAAATLLKELDHERLQRARTCFETVISRPGPDVQWTVMSEEPVVTGFVHEAMYADLLVLGQRPAGDVFSRDVPADFAETVTLSSGRPSIVVPNAGEFPCVGRRIVVAWKSSREAARAVAWALPLLQRAGHVHLAHWSEPGESHSPLGIERYLRLHGIDPMRHDFGPTSDVGEAMLAYAAEVGADLVVMGCYGHSRVRELVLGGATRHVLHSAAIPVFMAH